VIAPAQAKRGLPRESHEPHDLDELRDFDEPRD
jgi:hypothetical protein